MPIEIGLLSSQQDSFDHHEELSKLLTETDVFYVPLRNEFDDNGLNPIRDLSDLTKRFDEDLSRKHLIVTFRDIGYSLFLDSVQSIPDENDQSKIRVSGKMIVDGICVQFFGCFDYSHKTQQHSTDAQTQQINGVGRVELDEEYYRELSLAQISSENTIKHEETTKQENIIVEPVITHRTRQSTAKLKERPETLTVQNKPKTRSRAISENVSPATSASVSTSPPLPVQMTTPQTYSSISTTRSYAHSQSLMPYPLRSPRVKQHRPASPVHFNSPSTSRTSVSTTTNEYPQMNSTMESSQPPRMQIISHPPHFSSPLTGQTTMPIQIPSTSNTGLPPTSLPQLTNLFPMTQSTSLPTYFLPTANIAYITTATPSTTNLTGAPFDFTSLPSNASMLLITNPNQHPTQSVHILTPIDQRSLPFAIYAPSNLLAPTPTIPLSGPSHISNILQSSTINESSSIIQTKRPENEGNKIIQQQQQFDKLKQSTEQLPFKKRRYAGQQSRMATVRDDDDDVSDESAKK